MCICRELADLHPYFCANKLTFEDAEANLFGLAIPPEVLIGHVSTSALIQTMRHDASPATVEKYAAMLKADPSFEFDPILVAEGEFYDGGHRLRAYAMAGRATIPVVECGHIVLATFELWESWVDGGANAEFTISEAFLKSLEILPTPASTRSLPMST